jgi:hypothetical protein
MMIGVKCLTISLLTPFLKISEMVMQRRILKHITNYNTLSTEQYGFRIGLRMQLIN